MEIEIKSKIDNSLLNRKEIRFVIQHKDSGTPKRELIRSELADKLKEKKENIMINMMNSHFGSSETIGYAKIYKSVQNAKDNERKYILKRNNVSGEGKKKEKSEEEKKPVDQPPKEEKSEEKPKEEAKIKKQSEQEKKEPLEEPKQEKIEPKEEVKETSKEEAKKPEQIPKEENKEPEVNKESPEKSQNKEKTTEEKKE